VSAISWFILIFDIALAADAARRPASVWAAADRRKGYWVIALAFLGIIFFIPYAIGVLPRLIQAGKTSSGSVFEKRPDSPFEKTGPRNDNYPQYN
jgi:hypothetical protein